MKNKGKIKPDERDKIAIWRSKNIGVREIARRLDRSPGTISDEIKRNSFGNEYVAIYAQTKADKRTIKARARNPLKNKSIFKYVMKKLRSGWSPEQIAGRLKLKHPDNDYWHIHFETIYRYIYAQENKEKQLWEYLPRKQKKRRIKDGRKSQRCNIPDRVSIHDRPKEVEDRQEFGHWEGDSIVGKGHKDGSHTQVERMTRYLKAVQLEKVGAIEVVNAQALMFKDLPKKALKSTTVDNGSEFTNHKQFELPTYFCDPYASWQKGTNENTNGLIRRYLPKGTNFSTITKEEFDDIIQEINNRPRKCLGFKTPQEAFDEQLQIIKCSDSI